MDVQYCLHIKYLLFLLFNIYWLHFIIKFIIIYIIILIKDLLLFTYVYLLFNMQSCLHLFIVKY